MNKHHITGHNLFWLFLGVIIILILCVVVDCADAAEVHSELTLYTTTTDKDITIRWDDTNPNRSDEEYEFYVWNYGEKKKYLIGSTQAIQVTFKLPRTGLYIFFARACADVTINENTTYECSIWVNSNMVDLNTQVPYGKVEDPNNPGTYIQGKWMIYGHVAPPTGGGVE